VFGTFVEGRAQSRHVRERAEEVRAYLEENLRRIST